MRVWLICVVLFSLLAVGCSSISTSYDYDPSADFTAYRTYAWIKQPTNISGNARQAQAQDPLVRKRIMNSVDKVLAEKGLRMADDYQLLVVFHTGVQDKVQVTDWGYGYGPYRGWYGGGGVDVYQYQQGTLIIDFVDAESKQLVWRGTAQGVLSQSQPDPEQQQKKIDNVVGKMLKNYPPPGK
jgi:hypothetical protein